MLFILMDLIWSLYFIFWYLISFFEKKEKQQFEEFSLIPAYQKLLITGFVCLLCLVKTNIIISSFLFTKMKKKSNEGKQRDKQREKKKHWRPY